MDPVILAAHIDPVQGCKIIDVGCGCGIISLILGLRYKDVQIMGVEIQSRLAEIALLNIDENQMADRIRILNQDIRTTKVSDIQGPADIIISNPPYQKNRSGRLNLDIEKAVARHEIHLDLDQFFASANRLLTPRGQVLLIFPAQRLQDLVLAMEPHQFQLEWIRFIHPHIHCPAKLMLISCLKNGKGPCRVRPPLLLYERNHNPTNEYTAMFKP